jgi:hypothetical protein
MTPSPEPMDQLPEERPAASVSVEVPANPDAITEPGAIANEPASVAVGQVLPAAPSIEPAPAAVAAAPVVSEAAAVQSTAVAPTLAASAESPAPEPPPAAVAPVAPPAATRSAEPRNLAEWLASGRVRGRVRFADGSTSVLIDPDERQYFGPSALKATAPLFERDATLADFEPVSADVWSAQTAALGTPQPLARLIWFGALLAGQGRLAGGYDPSERFKLSKWPQTEREFPKHFRIATAMMKGPATVAELAEASSVPEADVADFVNASLATGFAEPHREPEPEPEASKTGGLFGRLRGR